MPPTQLRLLPAPRPLEERLGADWFRSLPDRPGIYRFLDATGNVLYIGKARSLRQRLDSYRRTQNQIPRIVRLIHAADRIVWEETPDEASALAGEAESIRREQPRFNRAGKWAAPPLWLRLEFEPALARLEWAESEAAGWSGPLPRSTRPGARMIAPLLWLAANPEAQAHEVPHQWHHLPMSAFPLPLPVQPLWKTWLRSWLEVGDTALLWELASTLEPRLHGFTTGFIRESWQRLMPTPRRSLPYPAG